MEEIQKICKELGIKNYTINDDMSIDVDGSVSISNKGLTEFPITFNKVTAYFDCSGNKLTTLKGGPKWVGKWFNCFSNNLDDLDYSPDYIGGKFICDEKTIGEKFEKNTITDYNNYIILYRRKLKIQRVLSKKKRKRGRPKKIKKD